MRLIVSVDALSPALTGIGRYTWELVTRLQQTPGLKQLRFYRAGRWVADPASLRRAEPVPERQGSSSAGGAAPPRVSAAYRWARRLYWRTTCRANVFHAPNYFLPPFARHGVVTVHDLSVIKFPETHPAERVRQWNHSFSQTLDLAAQLITDTEAVRREVIDHFGWPPDRVTAVPLGVSTDYRPRSADELRPALTARGLVPGGYTLCVATLEPRKRIDCLLAAYRRLSESVRRACPLVLVGGKGWQADRLMQQIADAQAEGWLVSLGFIEPDELPLLYAGARVFAYPSIYEGFGLPVAEAMASGVPVITSNRSCLPEVANGAAWLIDPDDSAGVAAALEQLFVDAEWRASAIRRGLEVASDYTWAKCHSNTMQVYEKALGRGL